MAGDSDLRLPLPSDPFDAKQEIEDHKGQRMVLEFLTFGLGASGDLEMAMNKLQQKFGETAGKKDGISFIRVDMDDKRNQELEKKYGVTVLPAVVFIGEDGKPVIPPQQGAFHAFDLTTVKDSSGHSHEALQRPVDPKAISNEENIATGLSKLTGKPKEQILDEAGIKFAPYKSVMDGIPGFMSTPEEREKLSEVPAKTQKIDSDKKLCTYKLNGDEIMSESEIGTSIDEQIAKPDGKEKVLDFYAVWCGPCNKLAPIFEQEKDKIRDKVDFISINVDDSENAHLLKKYGIHGFPTLVLIDGKEETQAVGLVDAKKALDDLDKKWSGKVEANEKKASDARETSPEDNRANFKKALVDMMDNACTFGACAIKSKSENIASGLATDNDDDRINRWKRYTHINVFDYRNTPEMTGFPPEIMNKLLKSDPEYLRDIEKMAIEKFNMPLTKEDLKHKR